MEMEVMLGVLLRWNATREFKDNKPFKKKVQHRMLRCEDEFRCGLEHVHWTGKSGVILCNKFAKQVK